MLAKTFNAFTKDLEALLQAIIGPGVDLAAFIKASTVAYEALLSNKPFISLLKDTQTLLIEISNNPQLSDDPATQQRLNAIMDRIEFEVNLLQNNADIRVAREEGEKIVAALKSDPINLRVYEDLRKLMKDADSDFFGALRAFAVPIVMEHLGSIPVQALNSTASK